MRKNCLHYNKINQTDTQNTVTMRVSRSYRKATNVSCVCPRMFAWHPLSDVWVPSMSWS